MCCHSVERVIDAPLANTVPHPTQSALSQRYFTVHALSPLSASEAESVILISAFFQSAEVLFAESTGLVLSRR